MTRRTAVVLSFTPNRPRATAKLPRRSPKFPIEQKARELAHRRPIAAAVIERTIEKLLEEDRRRNGA